MKMKIKECHKDEEEDALSLCDLPIYSSASSEWEKFSCESQSSSSISSSSSSESDQFFEFFSKEWNDPASSNQPPEKIIFCGKLIPQKKGPVSEKNEKRRKNIVRAKSSRKGPSMNDGEPNSKDMALRESESSSQIWWSRWPLFLFGMATRLPKEMDLKDMKNRQSRKISSSEGRGSRQWWWIIKALSCGGSSSSQVHAQAIVKAGVYWLPGTNMERQTSGHSSCLTIPAVSL